MTPLLRNWVPIVAVAVFAVLALLSKCAADSDQRALGAAIERNAILADSLSVAKAEGRKIDSVLIRDTVRLVRRLTTTQTLIDTLLLSDTVVLTKRESVLVFVADSLVKNCRDVLGSCTARIGNLNAQLSLVTQQRDLWHRRAQPSLLDQIKQLPGRAVSTAAIASVGYAACKIGGL